MKKTEALNLLSSVPAEYAGALTVMAPFTCQIAGSFALVGYAAAQAGHALHDLYERNEAKPHPAIQKQAEELAREMLNAQRDL